MTPQMKAIMERHKADPHAWNQSSIAVFHSGAGRCIGDTFAETVAPALALTYAGKFGSKLIMDFILAYLFGVAF